MKSIKIIKRKRDENTNETRSESQKPAEPSTRNLVNTVKTWIAEAEQRKRSQRCSLSALGLWYDSLPAGKYELTVQRGLACCDGPMVESNKINFEVVP